MTELRLFRDGYSAVPARTYPAHPGTTPQEIHFSQRFVRCLLSFSVSYLNHFHLMPTGARSAFVGREVRFRLLCALWSNVKVRCRICSGTGINRALVAPFT